MQPAAKVHRVPKEPSGRVHLRAQKALQWDRVLPVPQAVPFLEDCRPDRPMRELVALIPPLRAPVPIRPRVRVSLAVDQVTPVPAVARIRIPPAIFRRVLPLVTADRIGLRREPVAKRVRCLDRVQLVLRAPQVVKVLSGSAHRARLVARAMPHQRLMMRPPNNSLLKAASERPSNTCKLGP